MPHAGLLRQREAHSVSARARRPLAVHAYDDDKDGGLSGTDSDDQDPLNAFRYTAKRFDSGSGTLDMGARRFGPDTTRFLQQDQYMGALSDLGLSLDP